MSDKSAHLWQRRRFLQLGVGGAIGLAGGAIVFNQFKGQLKNQISSNSIATPAINNMDKKIVRYC